jgi:hypothetical protein
MATCIQIIPPKKVCSACKEEKESKYFCKNFELHDNLKSQCKKCMKERRKKKEKNIIETFIF